MPYRHFHSKNGFYVANAKTGKTFSNHPLTKQTAIKQREAIAISEASKKNKPVSQYFVK
jgi:hypothetical protein